MKALESPEATVLEFAKQFTEWENEMNRFLDDGEFPEELEARYDEIIQAYCTHKKRAYVDGCISFGEPPAYVNVHPDTIEQVEYKTKSRAHVETSYVDKKAYLFVVLKKSGEWRIDSVKWKIFSSDWENTLIGS